MPVVDEISRLPDAGDVRLRAAGFQANLRKMMDDCC